MRFPSEDLRDAAKSAREALGGSVARGSVGGAVVEGAGKPDGIPGGVEAASRAAFDLAIAHHLLFWRQVTLHVARGEPEPDQAETLSRSWEEPSQTDAGAWRATVRGFETSQRDLVGALTACDRELHRFHYHRFHDSYHIGQIMQQRAIQGLAPLV